MAEIGIVGLGDLGGRIALQAGAAGFDVIAFEPKEARIPKEAVDLDIVITGVKWPPESAESADEVVLESEIIHWCAPLGALATLNGLPEGRLVILHDSVMSSSYDAGYDLAARRGILGRIGIAHALMNPDSQVFVAGDIGQPDRTTSHMEELGLNPEQITVHDHDVLMAHSQARLAWGVLFDLPVLKSTPAKHLTPSGREYLEALMQRDASWTTSTLRSIFMNPYIPEAERMQALAEIDGLEGK